MKQTFLSALLFLLLFSCSRENKSVQTLSKDETVTAPSHIIIVVEENHSYDNIIGNASADYINSLADSGYLFKNYHGVDHPSQPNYVALFSGDQNGVTTDKCLANKINAENLYSQLKLVGKTLSYYSEDLPNNLTKCKSGNYARKHNASSDFTNVPDSVNKSFSVFPTNYNLLSDVNIIVPNLNHDMHNSSIAVADNWLQNNLGSLATWCKTNNSIFVVAWDEDDGTPSNHIPLIFYGNVNNSSDSVFYDHYNLTKTICSLFGASTTWTTNLSSRTVMTGF